MENFQTEHYQNKNCKIQYLEGGKGDIILFLHGGCVKASTYTDLLKQLSLNFHVIAPDLPCFGDSDVPNSSWSYQEYALFFSDFLKYLKLKNVIVIGHSLGGGIALHLTSISPQVSKLILVNSSGIATKDKENELIYKFFFKRTFQDLLLYKDLRVFNLIAKDFFTSLIKKSRKVSQISKVVFNLLYADFSDFQKIKIPTLIIANKQDEIFTPEQIMKLKTSIPKSKLLELTGNHTWCLYESQKFTTIVNDFVNSN